MATLAPAQSKLAPDTKFFLTMAIVFAAINVAAFSFFALMGISSFGAPLYVHVHAFTFFGWVVIYVTQNALVATGSTALHRKLGWFAAAYTIFMVIVGTLTTVHNVQRGMVPPLFEPAHFLIMNPLNVFCFAMLVLAGVAVRANTGWHRRLIYCGMASIMGPAFGRLLPPPLQLSGGMTLIFGILAGFMLIGVVRDRITHGRIHPAWWVGLSVLTMQWLVGEPIARTSFGLSLYQGVVDGTAGAAKPPYEKAPFPG
ncbi:hypothetical protein M9978_02090 [Sphingomonas sp. MG17]|uniref:Uncharacterized protein n=1 Tax=Sphingomonas tagetis TaxID=2949092 RepID=A0A9X2KKC5_9SPHN|nr:hypothetical protein [Sphingomonas tagetis]MCP3729206.1 hypothetical protein [Sphingomonas tagetis]